jgi:hypothetical protein
MTEPENIFDKPDRLIRIWENERNTRNLAVNLMWENMKYFGALVGSLLTAYTALLGYFSTTVYANPIPLNLMILFPIPVAIIFLTFYARDDLKQRKRRFLLVVTHLLKLEELLGLHREITDELIHFKEDKYLFVEYQKNLSKCNTTEAFIELEMRENKGAFNWMQNIYQLMRGIAGALIVLGIVLLVI